MDWALLAETGINGSLIGLMYSLVAMGIVLIYKSSSVPNLAQGSMTMLGAYIVLAYSSRFGAPLWLAIILAALSMFGIGIAIERIALRRLAGRPIIMILMMTLGLEILLRAGSLTIWGATGRPMPIGISDDPLFLGALLINRAYAAGAAVAIVMFGLFALFFRTRMGVVLRAISDDYTAAWSVGISVERGVALSWAMACADSISNLQYPQDGHGSQDRPEARNWRNRRLRPYLRRHQHGSGHLPRRRPPFAR